LFCAWCCCDGDGRHAAICSEVDGVEESLKPVMQMLADCDNVPNNERRFRAFYKNTIKQEDEALLEKLVLVMQAIKEKHELFLPYKCKEEMEEKQTQHKVTTAAAATASAAAAAAASQAVAAAAAASGCTLGELVELARNFETDPALEAAAALGRDTMAAADAAAAKAVGAVGEAERRPVKLIDFRNKTYLAPLTTVRRPVCDVAVAVTMTGWCCPR
jgi:hypothetical protein